MIVRVDGTLPNQLNITLFLQNHKHFAKECIRIKGNVSEIGSIGDLVQTPINPGRARPQTVVDLKQTEHSAQSDQGLLHS